MLIDYLDCFEQNIHHILTDNQINYTEVIRPELNIITQNIKMTKSSWQTQLENLGYDIEKYQTHVQGDLLDYLNNKLRNPEWVAIIKVNIADLPWSFSSDESDDDHWITIQYDQLIDPYYNYRTKASDLSAITANVVGHIGEHYTAYFIKKLNTDNDYRMMLKSAFKLTYDIDLLYNNLIRQLIDEQLSDLSFSEDCYKKLLHIANARMQWYHVENLAIELKESLEFSYQAWIALANIYLKVLVTQQKSEQLEMRLRHKIEHIKQAEYQLQSQLGV